MPLHFAHASNLWSDALVADRPQLTMAQRKEGRLLILCRRQDMMNYACRWADELGFEAFGCIDNNAAKDLLAKNKFTLACIGCVFWNDKFWAEELSEMKALLDEKGLAYHKMPTFGDVRSILQEQGMLPDEDDKKAALEQPAATAAIAG